MSDSVWFHLDEYVEIAFNFPSEIQEIFTEYGCFDLAQQLSTRLGFPVQYIYSSDSSEPLHGLIILPNGRYADILGIWTSEGVLKFWDEYEKELSFRNAGLEYSLRTCPEIFEYDFVSDDIIVTVLDLMIAKIQAYLAFN